MSSFVADRSYLEAAIAMESDDELVISVVIQWHICALAGSERDVASGSVRARTYVALLLSVRLGMASKA